jgi:hypothetical protein
MSQPVITMFYTKKSCTSSLLHGKPNHETPPQKKEKNESTQPSKKQQYFQPSS